MAVSQVINKPTLKISVDSNSSSDEESEISENGKENFISDNNCVDADTDSIASDDGKEAIITNEGWADSVAKILGSNKPKNKKTLVLSRAKKHADVLKTVKQETPAFEIVRNDNEIKVEDNKQELNLEPAVKKVKHEKPSIRTKPNILEKDRERLLSKIATKGVVQLFNAVRNQQKNLDNQMDRGDLTETKKEKILKKFDKRAFLDTLMGQTKSVIVDDAAKKFKNEVKKDEEPRWNALRDDFMMGAKMKDWDKESVDE